jgi:cytochrome b subunit of formate dehydrogenase
MHLIAQNTQQDTQDVENAQSRMAAGRNDAELKKAKKRISIILCFILMAISIVTGVVIGWRLRVLDYSDHAEMALSSGRTVRKL